MITMMQRNSRTVNNGSSGTGPPQTRVRRHMGLVLFPICVVLLAASACAGKSSPQAAPVATDSNATTGRVAATIPPIPPGTKVCDTVSTLAGWPTTAPASPSAYDCILDALATGVPAQMSTITGIGKSGRKARDGHDVLTREIVTVRVLRKDKVQVITDLTEDGGTVTSKICAGFQPGSGGTDCS